MDVPPAERGRPPAPGGGLLAACLIVRDEAPVLGRCLGALAGLVDEIVVHDTGSTDDSVELARAAGAVVVRGTWAEDFAAARNVALDRAGCDWVLSVDADEVVRADAGALRAFLDADPGWDGWAVRIANVGAGADGAGYGHTGPRLFRRVAARWQGRVHEQPVDPSGRPLRLGALPEDLLLLEHHGYADPDVLRVKAIRNAHLLRRSLAEHAAGGDPAALSGLLLDLGRTLVTTGELQEAVDALEAVRELAPRTAHWQQATDVLARVLLGAGEDEVVLVLCDQLEQSGAERAYCDWLRAQALTQLGEVGPALELLNRIDRLVDPAGREHDLGRVHQVRDLVARLAALR